MRQTRQGLLIEFFSDFFKPPVDPAKIKADVVSDFKHKVLFNYNMKDSATISEVGSDIIMRVRDPRIASGLDVFKSEDAYYQAQDLWMQLPS